MFPFKDMFESCPLGPEDYTNFSPEYAIWHCHCFCPIMPKIMPSNKCIIVMYYTDVIHESEELFSGYYIVTLCTIICSSLKCYFALVQKYYLKWKILFQKQLMRVAPIVTSWLLHSNLEVQSHYHSTTGKCQEGLLH